MPRHKRRDPMFLYGRHSEGVIVQGARRYLSYRSGLRDFVELLADRPLDVHPSTICH